MMNLYAWIILIALITEFILDLTADLLNLKGLTPSLPQEFSGFIDEATYKKSQEYTRVTTKFGIFTSTVYLATILGFWFCKGFNTLDIWIRSFGFGPVLTGLIYMGCLMLLLGLLNLPFSIYRTFVIEERFGFNKTTPRTFLFDIFKILTLALILGGSLLTGILAFFQYAGAWAWFACWVISTLFILIVQFIAPTWIMPLFNKFRPLEDGPLKSRIFDYAREVEFPLHDVFVMDGSKRSTKSNAFFTGFGKNKRIALYDTLIENHSIEELVTILAHEIGHYKKKHILIGMILSILHMGFLFYLLNIFLTHRGLYEAFFMQHMSVYTGLIFFGMLYTPLDLFLSLFLNILSRRHERQADAFAVSTTQSKEAFITALKKLSVHNLFNLTPHPFYVFLHASHPPVLERIRTIKRFP